MFNGKITFKKSGSRHQKSLSKKIVYTVAFALMALYALTILYFFVYGILISLKLDQAAYINDLMNVNIFSLPNPFSLENVKNYSRVFTTWEELDGTNSFLTMAWNSVWRTTSSSFLSWFTTAIVCYILVHYKSKFTEALYVLGLFISMFPLYGSQAAQYKLYDTLNLIDNPSITFVSITLYGSYFFYMYAFWKSISHSYAEAASIDGANHYQILFKIMFPQVLPSIVALFVMQFITAWNDYESTAAYMSAYPNLAYGTYMVSEAGKNAGNTPQLFAGVMLSLLPILILFVAFQNTIMEKVYLGGLKE